MDRQQVWIFLTLTISACLGMNIDGDIFSRELTELSDDAIGIKDLQLFYDRLTYESGGVASGDTLVKDMAGRLANKFQSFKTALEETKSLIETEITRFTTQNSPQECCKATGLSYDTHFGVEINKNNICYSKPSNTLQSKFPTDAVISKMKKNIQDNGDLLWQYYGDETGTFVIYPSRKSAIGCNAFDPRYRTFYARGAAPIAKDIVIVLDLSQSMNEQYASLTLLTYAKQAAIAVLDTLSPHDRVAVMGFTSTVTKFTSTSSDKDCYSQELSVATRTNKLEITKFINRLQTRNGDSNFTLAFHDAIKFFKDSPPQQSVERDRRIIFVADGEPSVSDTSCDAIRAGSGSIGNNMALHLIGLGSGFSNVNRFKDLANSCYDVSKGQTMTDNYELVQNPVNLKESMARYYRFISNSASDPVFSVPFVDPQSNKTGLVMSLCLPIISNAVREGVVCSDIRLSELLSDIQYFKEGELSHAFLIDGQGRVMLHYLQPFPQAFNYEPDPIDVRTLERGSDAAEVVASMMSGGTGNRTFMSKRTIPRGSVLYEGIVSPLVRSHYFWTNEFDGFEEWLHLNIIYDKRDDFNFSITNFPFLSSNIPSSPAYGVFISQLIRYARASTKYTDFVLRARRLSDKLLSQGYVCDRLTSSLRKFYGRYGELVIHYDVPLSRMVAGTNFSLCVVLGDNDDQKVLQADQQLLVRNEEIFLYHRRDIYPRDFSDCRHYSRFATKEKSMVMLTPHAFDDPNTYLFKSETAGDAKAYTDYMNRQSSNRHGIKVGVRDSVSATYEAEKIWIRNREEFAKFVVWRYLGTEDGHLRVFPAVQITHDYDHFTRAWWKRTMGLKGQNVVIAPYIDLWGAGMVVTMCKALYEGKTNGNHAETDKATASICIDFPYSYFSRMFISKYPDCSRKMYNCIIVDINGFLVVHPDFSLITNDPDIERIHLGAKEGAIMNDLIAEGYMTESICTNFETNKNQYTYYLSLQNTEEVDRFPDGKHYKIVKVRDSNIFIIIKSATSSSPACCSDSKISPDAYTCASQDCCLCYTTASYDVCKNSRNFMEVNPTCSARVPDSNTPSPNDTNRIKGLPVCYDVACQNRQNISSCYDVAGCGWCEQNYMGNILGEDQACCNIHEVCPFGKQVEGKVLRHCSHEVPGTATVAPSTGDNVPLIAGISAGIVILVAITVILVVCLIRRAKPKELDDPYITPISTQRENTEHQLHINYVVSTSSEGSTEYPPAYKESSESPEPDRYIQT